MLFILDTRKAYEFCKSKRTKKYKAPFKECKSTTPPQRRFSGFLCYVHVKESQRAIFKLMWKIRSTVLNPYKKEFRRIKITNITEGGRAEIRKSALCPEKQPRP